MKVLPIRRGEEDVNGERSVLIAEPGSQDGNMPRLWRCLQSKRIYLVVLVVIFSVLGWIGLDIRQSSNKSNTENKVFVGNEKASKDIYPFPEVKVSGGRLLGGTRTSPRGTTFHSFQGIPFAAPPVGSFRFQKPQPLETWEGLRNVSGNFGIKCTQYSILTIDNSFHNGSQSDEIHGQEDCLYLNVYSPNVFNPEPLPVIVWFFGGAFFTGDNTWDTYGPNNYMDQGNVVFVTVNYRVGAFGFLSLGIEEAPGNQAIWDMLVGLKWVKKNIHVFGGDSEKVTIAGESSGSFACSYLIVSPVAQGLFQRVIMESGAFPSPEWYWNSENQGKEYGLLASEHLGCQTSSALSTLECLQDLDMSKIQLVSQMPDLYSVAFQVMVDGELLPASPLTLLSNGDFNKVDVIIGSTRDEGLGLTFELLLDPTQYDSWKNNWDVIGPVWLFRKSGYGDISPRDVELANKVLEFYIGDKQNFNSDNFDKITNMITDACMWVTVHKFSEALAKNGNRVFQYMYSYRGKYSFEMFFGVNATKWGVSHGDDLILSFNPFYGMDIDLPERDRSMSDELLRMWTNFANFGIPTLQGEKVQWAPLSKSGQHHYFNIDFESSMVFDDPEYNRRMQFWENLNYTLPVH